MDTSQRALSFKVQEKMMRIFVCSDQAHSSVERAGLLGGVKLRLLPADENLRLRGETLECAIQEDRRNGLIPFYVSIRKIRINSTVVSVIKNANRYGIPHQHRRHLSIESFCFLCGLLYETLNSQIYSVDTVSGAPVPTNTVIGR
jgi:hypothetical protein